MKFQKGLLDEVVPVVQASQASATPDAVPVQEEVRPVERKPTATPLPVVEKERLFETLEKETSGARKYLMVFGVVVLLVIAIGSTIAYLTLPGIGDKVRLPAAAEIAVRDHFLTKEKRTATNIIFYQCEGFYDARVGVETRNDIPNPLFRLDTYTARITPRGDQWEITAAPITPPEQFAACK